MTSQLRQSPIDLSADSERGGPRLEFEYRGHAVEIDHHAIGPLVRFEQVGAVNHLRIEARMFRLVQFHWHTPAEHAVEGAGAAMELHLVHQDEADAIAVVGVRYEIGTPDPAVQRLIDATPKFGEAVQGGFRLPAADYAPSKSGYFHYIGSLTAPPFTEPVEWYVSDLTPTISRRQAEALQRLTGGPNARCLQERNGRRVVHVRGLS